MNRSENHNTEQDPENLSLHDLLRLYQKTLFDDVLPFWKRYALDTNGGINTCVSDDGNLISRDRWNWSQWRAVWVYSKLHNSFGGESEWLQIAQGIYSFVKKSGTVAGGHWPLLLDGEGNITRGYESIYVDGFAIYALAELYRATSNQEVLGLAMDTYHAAVKAIHADEPPPAYPYPIPSGRLAHGISMLFSLAFHELAEVSGDRSVREAALKLHRKVMEGFLRSERGLLLEWMDDKGNEISPPEGAVVIPGHAIESMWFQILIAQSQGDEATISIALQAIQTHLQIGWDPVYEGLILAVDADGREQVAWNYADTKLWWPQTEALQATLMAYQISREDWCLDWHQRLRRYCYSHYPVAQYGEWRQKLDRQGNPISQVVALPVKDPFHLPRALIYMIKILEDLISESPED